MPSVMYELFYLTARLLSLGGRVRWPPPCTDAALHESKLGAFLRHRIVLRSVKVHSSATMAGVGADALVEGP